MQLLYMDCMKIFLKNNINNVYFTFLKIYKHHFYLYIYLLLVILFKLNLYK